MRYEKKKSSWHGIVLLSMISVFSVVQSSFADKAFADQPKPKVAFLPLGGNANEELRDKVGFALRAKLDRTEKFEVLDGYAMSDLAEEATEPITFATGEDVIRKLAKSADASIIAWGELVNTPAGATLHIKVLDLRQKDSKPHEIEKVIAEATDLRFVSEQILETLPGVEKFAHPVEQSVWDDAKARELWAKNPNLAANGDFSDNGAWQGIYLDQQYTVNVSKQLPAIDSVCIYQEPATTSRSTSSGKATTKPATNNVLAMNLSRGCAENNGMACLGEPIKIEPNTRYRLQFRYKSDGPFLHVFVKGYTTGQDIKGDKALREVYRRQVPPSGPTNGKWVTVIDDLNPQHATFPVQYLRIDLYAYLSPGVVLFDDVQLKAVGAQTHIANDDAVEKPATQPRTNQ